MLLLRLLSGLRSGGATAAPGNGDAFDARLDRLGADEPPAGGSALFRSLRILRGA